MFSQDSTCPDLLDFTLKKNSNTGLSPSMVELPNSFFFLQQSLRAVPLSLAATNRISVDFFSCSYLDVSVLCVCLFTLCIQVKIPRLSQVGFPIRRSPGYSLFTSLPKLIAGYHVLHRLQLPRHPSYALNYLTKYFKLIKLSLSKNKRQNLPLAF